MRITEVARTVGVNKETIRYYERRGLLPRPPRSPGGHRMYNRDAVEILRAIKAAQRWGFTLADCADLLGGRTARKRADGLPARARDTLERVEAQLEELTAMRTRLRAVVDAGCTDLRRCVNAECEAPVPGPEHA